MIQEIGKLFTKSLLTCAGHFFILVDNGDGPEAEEDDNEPHDNHDVDMLERPQGFPGGSGRYCLI